MDNSCNLRLINRIFDNFERFRLGQVNADDMIANIYGNLTALEGVNQDFVDEFRGYVGEIGVIKYTTDSEFVNKFILDQVNNFESYLKQYFNLEQRVKG